jgi:hypothetical protein
LGESQLHGEPSLGGGWGDEWGVGDGGGFVPNFTKVDRNTTAFKCLHRERYSRIHASAMDS